MANEISITAKAVVTNGLFKSSADVGTVQFDQTTIGGGNPGVVNVTTAAGSIAFGTTATVGYVWIRNLSTASTVRVQSTGSVVFATFLPKQLAVIPRNTGAATWQLKATTAGGTAWADVRGYHV